MSTTSNETPRQSIETSPGKSARGSAGLRFSGGNNGVQQRISASSIGGDDKNNKRDRVDSGSSVGSMGRFSGKLKRVFSRKNSGSEEVKPSV